jgi:DNA-binding sugar fermentation-stimulating protein
MSLIYTIPTTVYKTIIIHRPSKVIKSPYIADLRDPENLEHIVQGHSPALGCGGYICSGSIVYVVKSKSSTSKSSYSIIGVEKDNVKVLCHPSYANLIVHELLQKKMISIFENLENIQSEVVQTEYTEGDEDIHTSEKTRFDFCGYRPCGKKVYIEVKCVPLADVFDVDTKTYKKLKKTDDLENFAIFPCGESRKAGLVSPRALKHIQTLEKLHTTYNIECHMVYIVMRPDVAYLKISELDSTYRSAVLQARECGVNVHAYAIAYDDYNIHLHKSLNVV